MSTYVYGITRRSHPSLPEKMGGVGDPPRPVRIIEAGKLVALVSDAPEGLKPKRRDLLAHQSVLAEAGAAGAVLPMRFGGISPDDDAVTAVLGEREDHFLERLKVLDGRVEYNVKATHDEEAVLHQVLAEVPEVRALSEANRAEGGGSYERKLQLGEMVVAAVKQREVRDATLVEQVLGEVAENISHGPQSSGWLANISFLVDRERSELFVAAVQTLLREQPQLVLQLNGPLPPYSFVD
ncbi:GvpL/GvpF family gas vesicle protein [Streptomyces sp. NBC_01142]|uniref:GvpL/GvpF family gas vesicle protein n=1 Tax=Streptomyces sp. NBC_01142 TaxID=2975865 RepID=UPI00224F5E78|nr:GvpL/GvpF family gas vesicle protein [Streptomyces sp. NBC_01142]MCX4825474.1 GvpL/GvpF family gas vesicle protein [Streptomyces sp. NBC_01142]